MSLKSWSLTSDDLQWFELDGLPDNTIPYVRQAIGCLRKNVKYSEYGF